MDRQMSRSESRMAAALEDYLRTGGLPEVVLADELLRPRILKEYVDLLFYKDLAPAMCAPSAPSAESTEHRTNKADRSCRA